MRTKDLATAALAGAAATTLLALAADQVKLNVKMGLWEVKTTAKAQGDIPEELLARVPPERRAQMIAMLKANAEKPRNYKQCMTTEKLSEGWQTGEPKEGCERTIVSNTSTELAFREKCTREEGEQTINVRFHADSSQSVSGTVSAVMNRNGQAMSVNREMHGTWLGSSCGAVKDVEIEK